MTALPSEEGLQKEVIDAYNGLAAELYGWESLSYLLSKAFSDYMLLSKIDIKGKKVLNIGCFLPVDELQFGRMVEQWVAIDLSQESIKTAERIVREQLPPAIAKRLVFQVADARDLPFEDSSFDVSVCFSTLDHIPGADNRQKVVNEMARVTRKGGHVIITVPNKLDLLQYWGSRKAQQEGTCKFVYEHWFSPWELKRMLAISGLRVIECTSTAFNPYSYFDQLLRKLKLAKLKIYLGGRFGYLAQKV